MKSLQDFYTEQGICRTELAAQLGLSEADLQEQEELPMPTDETQQAITADFGLAENYFTEKGDAPICYKNGEPIVDRARLRGYFFKVSLGWQLLVNLIVVAPYLFTSIAGMVAFFVQFDAGVTEPFFQNETFIKAELLVFSLMLIFPAFSGILLARHITKKTGLQGNLKKYQYLYYFLPDVITLPLFSVTSALMQIQTAQGAFVLVQQGILFVVSVCSLLLSAWICMWLLDAATEGNAARQQKLFRLLGGFAATAGLLRFAVTCICYAVFPNSTADALSWSEAVLQLVLTVSTAVCIGFVPMHSQKSEAVFLKVLPLTAMLIQIPITVLRIFA